jgi:hypothetical protein
VNLAAEDDMLVRQWLIWIDLSVLGLGRRRRRVRQAWRVGSNREWLEIEGGMQLYSGQVARGVHLAADAAAAAVVVVVVVVAVVAE